MSHNDGYDHLVLNASFGTGLKCTDYWRLDQSQNFYANLAWNNGSAATGDSATDILPATNNDGATYYDGSDSYVTFTYNQLSHGLDFPASPHNFSVECWVQPQADMTADDVIGIAQKPGCFGIYLAYGIPTFFTQLSGAGRINCGSGTALTVDDNYHLVGTYNASTGDLKLYVNGSLTNTVNTGSTGDACDHTGANFTIGSWDTSALFFNGLITNVALYNCTLNSTQVGIHYSYSG